MSIDDITATHSTKVAMSQLWHHTESQAKIAAENINATLVDMRFVKPLDQEHHQRRYQLVTTA